MIFHINTTLMAKTYLLLLFILIQSLDDSQAQSISGFTQGYVSNSETKLITGDYLTTDLFSSLSVYCFHKDVFCLISC